MIPPPAGAPSTAARPAGRPDPAPTVFSAICTLVEGDFHLGLGALTHSLVQHGFEGNIWVGFRGSMPPWARAARPAGPWTELAVTQRVQLRFVPVSTAAHFTNYKADFKLQVWNQLEPAAGRLFYFDPDIVLKTRWSFLEEWAGYGIALVEDVNAPLPASHPRRGAWRAALARRDRTVRQETTHYVNGGFVGIDASQRAFLEEWRTAMVLVGEEIGGLDHSMFSFAADQADHRSPAFPFSKTDQDALNIALMTAPQTVSVMGAEGMDFRPGGWTLSHALGPEKPWRKHFLRAAFAGRPPTQPDREFWRYAVGPLPLFPSYLAACRRLTLAIAGAVGRF